MSYSPQFFLNYDMPGVSYSDDPLLFLKFRGNQKKYLYPHNIERLFKTFAIIPMTQFVLFRINDEKVEFPPFGRVDTACYPASLLGKAY